MSCENCKLVDRMATAERDIEELQKNRNDANVKTERIETTVEYIKTAVDSLVKKIDKMIEAPGKRWDIVTNTTIAGIVSAIVAAIMFLILK